MNTDKKKYVIYTAIVGGYDEALQPLVVDDRFDYILFSNDIKDEKVGVWQVRPIHFHNNDNTRICRYVKTHPKELLPNYEFSIWIDSNVQIITSFVYERCVELYLQKSYIATMKHLERNCIYEEAFSVLERYLEFEAIVVNWCHYLREQKYPENLGLFETNVLYRVHIDEVVEFNRLWWSFIEEYSRRDQLSFNYVLWKLGIVCEYILPKEINTNNSLDFKRINHVRSKTRSIDYCGKLPWLMRYLDKVPSSRDEIREVYFRIFRFPFPVFFSAVLGQIYRLKYLIDMYLIKK